MKEPRQRSSAREVSPWGDTLASGLAVAALALLAGFISLPF